MEPGAEQEQKPAVLPDWGLEPPQWTEEPAAPGRAESGADGEAEPVDQSERLTWRSEANNPWSLDDEGDDPPPGVVGGE